MISQFQGKKTAFALQIRKRNKQTIICRERNSVLSSRICSFYKEALQDTLSNKDDPLCLLNQVYQDLTSCSPPLLPAVSSAATSLLSQLERLIIQNHHIQPFLQIASQIIKVGDEETLDKLISSNYLNWLFNQVLRVGEMKDHIIQPLLSVFTSLTQASLQSNSQVKLNCPVTELVQQYWNQTSRSSLTILSAVLMHASPEDLGARQTKQLRSLARFLFEQAPEDTFIRNLLFWITTLISFPEADQQIVKTVMDEHQPWHSRLALFNTQTIQQQWMTYQDIRRPLLDIADQLNSSSHQRTFLTILSSCVFNSSFDESTILTIYYDFFFGKIEALLQKPLLSSLLHFFSFTAPVLLEIQDPMIPATMVACLQLIRNSKRREECKLNKGYLSEREAQPQRRAEQKERREVLTALIQKRMVTEEDLASVLTKREIRNLWNQVDNCI